MRQQSDGGPFFLGVIPARGGSKGIPGKNLKEVGGVPLLIRAIRSAVESTRLSAFLVSTDDRLLLRKAVEAGAPAPFVRPAELSADGTPGMAVLLHASKFHEEETGVLPDYVVCLQPTSPFRTGEHIDMAIALILETGADAVVSVTESPFNPAWLQTVSENGALSPLHPDLALTATRQEARKTFLLNGAVYVIRTRTLIEKGTWVGADVRALLMDAESSVDVDTPLDLAFASFLAEKKI